MGRSHWHPRSCKVCGITDDEAHISQRGYCEKDWLALQLENNAQLEAGEGPFYEHWLYRTALAVRRRIVAFESVDAPGEEA